MKRSDLKNGHILETVTGVRYFVLRNPANSATDIVVDINSGGYYYLDRWNENLKFTNGQVPNRKEGKDIKKVYTFSFCDFTKTDRLVWEREPSINIDIKINGKEANLSDISEETLLSLRDSN